MSQDIHGIDLLNGIADMPDEGFAFSGCLAHERIEVEDTIALDFKYPNGATCVIKASTACRPGFARRIELCGDKGSAFLEDYRIVRWQFDDEGLKGEAIRSMKSGAIVVGSVDPLAIVFQDHRIQILVGAIREKSQLMIPGPEARNAVRLILHACQSAAASQVVCPGCGRCPV